MTCPFPGELAGRQADGFALSSLLNWDPAMSTTTFTLSHIKLEFSSHPPSLKAYVFVCFVVTKILASFFFLFSSVKDIGIQCDSQSSGHGNGGRSTSESSGHGCISYGSAP